MSRNSAHPDDVVAQWKRVSTKFQAMTPEEKRQTFVSAGILTKSGKVHKRYRNVIVPIGAKSAAKTKAKAK